MVSHEIKKKIKKTFGTKRTAFIGISPLLEVKERIFVFRGSDTWICNIRFSLFGLPGVKAPIWKVLTQKMKGKMKIKGDELSFSLFERDIDILLRKAKKRESELLNEIVDIAKEEWKKITKK